MTVNNSFVEDHNLCWGFGPVDMTTAANNGDWISLKGYERCTAVLFKAAGTANDDPVFTLKQATDVAGAGSKDLLFTRLDFKAGVLNAVGTWTTVTQAPATSYTNTVHAEVAAIYVVDIYGDMLDVNGGFDCVQVSVPDVGAAAQLGAAFYILRGARYRGVAFSAIVD